MWEERDPNNGSCGKLGGSPSAVARAREVTTDDDGRLRSCPCRPFF